MIRRAFLFSVIAEVLTTLSMLATFRLASTFWGTEGLGEWVLMRRVVSLAWPVVLCGLEISLTLAVAKAKNHDRRTESSMMVAGLLTVTVTGGALLLTAFLVPGFMATLFFGSAEQSGLVLPAFAMVTGLSAYAVVYAVFRGRMQIVRAGAFQIAALCVVPLIAMPLVDSGARGAMLLVALVTMALAILAASRWLTRKPAWREIWAHNRAIVGDGLPRMPAAFGVMALFSFPPLSVAHAAGLGDAAFLSLALTVVTISGSLLTPITVVLLPRVARYELNSNRALLAQHRRHVLMGALLLGSLIAIASAVFSRSLATALLGHEEPTLAGLLGWSALAAAPYMYFVCGRPLIDAHAASFTVAALVAGAVATYLAVFGLLVSLELEALDAALAAHVISVYTLAVCAHLRLGRLTRSVA